MGAPLRNCDVLVRVKPLHPFHIACREPRNTTVIKECPKVGGVNALPTRGDACPPSRTSA